MLKTHVYNDYRDMCAAYQIEPTTASGKDLSESFFVLFAFFIKRSDEWDRSAKRKDSFKRQSSHNPPNINNNVSRFFSFFFVFF